MLIAVISDSHNNEKAINIIKEYINNADVLLFLGDGEEDIGKIKESFKGEVYAVNGNCDMYSKNPDELLLNFEGKKIFMCHGHKYNVKYSYNNIYYRGKELDADIVLFGHTHIPIIEVNDNMIMMNPGSISRGAAMSGQSMGYIEIEKGEQPISYIKEVRHK